LKVWCIGLLHNQQLYVFSVDVSLILKQQNHIKQQCPKVYNEGAMKVITPSKNKFLVTIIISLLIISSVYSFVVPGAYAAEITTEQKALDISSNVLGIDAAKYNGTTTNFSKDSQLKFMDTVAQEDILYNLTSDSDRLSLLYTFAKGNVQMIQVLEDTRAQRLVSTASDKDSVSRANIVGAAIFLTNYEKQTVDSLYNSLKTTLKSVKTNSNQTITDDNLQLEVTSFSDGSTNFKWYYAANGAIAPYSKFIALNLKNGFLSAFVDNWHLYDIGGTSVKISKENAIAIALESARTHNWSLAVDSTSLSDSNLNESNVRWTTLLFDGSLNADKTRSDDPLQLYPVWRVGIALDKWYGYMYGIQVDVWADNGQVRSVQEAWSTVLPNETEIAADKQPSASAGVSMPILASIAGMVLIACSVVLIGQKKRLQSSSAKPLFKRTGGILLCILLCSTIIFATIEAVSATTRGAVVWGSESTDAGAYPNSWRKSSTEIDCQRATAINLADYFANHGGYSGNNGVNHQGIRNPGSENYQIYNDINTLQNNNNYIAVVDFDHGVGGYPIGAPPSEQHYMFEDNSGTIWGTRQEYQADPQGHTDWNHGIFDMHLYTYTHPEQVIFAYISACQSANIVRLGQGMLPSQWPPYNERAIGMPFAWTHRLVHDKSSYPGFSIAADPGDPRFGDISDDAYGDPDWGNQVYIGFPDGSASLEQGIPFGYGNPYYYWVCSFLGHALYDGISVNQALDAASLQFMGISFSGTQLRTGFTAYWAGFPTYDGNTLAVYGNGNIHLRYYNPPPDIATTPSISGPTAGSSGSPVGSFSAFATNPYGHDIQYNFDWGDGTTTQVWSTDGHPATNVYHTWSTGGLYNVKVQAKTASSGWSSWSNTIVVNIDNSGYWLTVDAYDQYGLFFTGVSIDGNYYGTPVSVLVGPGYHSVWAEPYPGYSYLTGFSDGYGNGDYRPIYSNTQITAYYESFW